MDYVRISEGFNKYKLIPSTQNIYEVIQDKEKDYYVSIFKYNEDQYQQWLKTRTVAGIKDVTTNILFFDFDNSSNIEKARQDTITLVERLITDGIDQSAIQVCFSGNKGFSVQVNTDKVFTQDEFKNITFHYAEDLSTFDKVVNDAQRIIRVLGTKHNTSKLYKFPLSINQLTELPVSMIKSLASDFNNIDEDIVNGWTECQLSDKVFSYKNGKVKTEIKSNVAVNDLDISLKPKWLTEAKYALQQGYFIEGERSNAFMILASTYKNQGFTKEIVYRMLKGVAEIQALRNNTDRFSDEELWNNVVETIFSQGWKGGQYSYENTPLLQEVTKRLNLTPPSKEENPLVEVSSVNEVFKRFATEIDRNTIKLGINKIDQEIRVTTSMLVGLLAAPSAGKTSLSLSFLNECTKNKVKSVFFSLDMGAPLVFQRLIQKHLGLTSKQIFEAYQSNNESVIKKIEEVIPKEYEHTKFCFRSGLTVEDIREFILKEQETTGEKIKLIVLDYLECVSGPFSDSTANTALIAQKLKDLANDFEMCVVLLLQPQKHAGDPSDELLSYRNIKGSSAIEQAASVIFTMSRPGFSPKNREQDRFLSINVVKNRMGALATFDFGWKGLTGEVFELDETEKEELNDIRKRKETEKAADL
jgi:hypothetical protein